MTNTESQRTAFIMEDIDQGKLMREIADYANAGKDRLAIARLLAAKALVHYHKHGDATALTTMQNAFPSHERGKAFGLWVKAHAPVKWDSGDSEKKILPRYVKNKKSDIPLLMDSEEAIPVINAALDCPFDVFSKESAIPVFSKNLPDTLRRIVDDSKKAVLGEGRYEKTGPKPLTAIEIRALNCVRDAIRVLTETNAEPEVTETEADVELQDAA